MEILELIETIERGYSDQDTFYFVMEEHNAMAETAYLVNHLGEQVSACDYSGTEVTSHYIQGSEDAIGFLFDADIALWKLVSLEISDSWYDSKQWHITLRRK